MIHLVTVTDVTLFLPYAYTLLFLLLYRGYRILSSSFFPFPFSYRKDKVEAQAGSDRPMLTVPEFALFPPDDLANCALGKLHSYLK